MTRQPTLTPVWTVRCWSWTAWLVTLALLALVALVSYQRAQRGSFDFHHFYQDARFVWDQGRLPESAVDPPRQLPFYLPAVPALLAPLTAGGRTSAALLWASAHVLSLGLVVWIVWRRFLAGAHPIPRRAALVLLLVAMSVTIYEAARFNQTSFVVLALVLVATIGVLQNRPLLTGLPLSLAIVGKLLPALLAVWVLLKRQWGAALVTMVMLALVVIVPPLIVFGPQRTVTYHQEWWAHNVGGVLQRGALHEADRPHFRDHRNQSLPVVLDRLSPHRLSPAGSRGAAYAVMAVLLVGLLSAARRPAARLGLGTLLAESATFAVAMMVFSPLVRTYYLVWALPAVALLVRWGLDLDGPRRQRFGQIGFAVWVVGQLLWLSPTARAAGVHLWTLIAIGALLLTGARRPAEPPGFARDSDVAD